MNADLERRARQDLEAGFLAAGFIHTIDEHSPDHKAWSLDLAATSEDDADLS